MKSGPGIAVSLQEVAVQLAAMVRRVAPDGIGVVVLTFDREDVAEQAYASNLPGNEENALAALELLVTRLNVRKMTKKIGGGH